MKFLSLSVQFVYELVLYYYYWIRLSSWLWLSVVAYVVYWLFTNVSWYPTFFGCAFLATYIMYLLSSSVRDYMAFSIFLTEELYREKISRKKNQSTAL